VCYPIQDLELNNATTKRKAYSDEKDPTGHTDSDHEMPEDDEYERIKGDIVGVPCILVRLLIFQVSSSRGNSMLLGRVENEIEGKVSLSSCFFRVSPLH
jgi:hypothetical protein